jgi:hypothetical protein
MQIYQTPGGPVIGQLRPGQRIEVLYRQQTVQGLVWVEIQDNEGRVGWVPLIYLNTILPTGTPTMTLIPFRTPTVSR